VAESQTLPAILYIHGGGFVLGRPEMVDDYLADLANDLKVVVVTPDYRLAPEHPFADNANFYLLDQKLIRLDGAPSSFEFCDLLTPNHDIIHVKKYSSSSVLSHLFSQAYVSAEAPIHEPYVTTRVNEYLAQESEFRFVFNPAAQPRNRIVFAIMQTNEALHMPFFSKVNFRQFAQRLTAMGYKVEVCRIPT
jgi:uncharacterized protein (TIGR04141 family)